MATEYKLSYTAEEIDRRLGEVDKIANLQSQIDNLSQNQGTGGSGNNSTTNAVLYTAQTLTEEQKIQARSNIGAVSEESVEQFGNKIELIDNAVLFTQQTLSEEQKAQVRANIGAKAEGDSNVTIEEVEYYYDGDRDSDEYTWVNDTAGNRAFVKVGDIPDGKINLVGGFVSVVKPANTYQNYSFDITEDMLETSVTHSGWVIHASVNGLTQVFFQNPPTGDNSLVAHVIVCTRAGQYDIGFNGWGELITFAETGIYFMDNRTNGGNKYVESMTCTIIETADSSDENPAEYQGNEIQVFNRGLCIGDSITEGVFNHNDGETVIKKYSYPNFLKRLTGVDIVNAGIAGLTSKTWYEASLDSSTQYGKWVNNEWVWYMSPETNEGDVVSDELNYSDFDFAVIHLGINDIGMMGDATLDETISTFETNINNIINKLKTASSGIKVFLATIIPCYAVSGNVAYETLNEKIREIANTTEDVFLIDLNMYSACFDNTPYENQHLTALGYHKMASEISAYISYIISKNLEDFKWVQFIGTTHIS